jgi:Zn-dependent M28 family amino/carboxypeptidase
MWRLFLGFLFVLAVGVGLLWWSLGKPMPKRDVTSAARLSPDEITLRDELRADVQRLGGDIGERNMSRYPQLLAAADFIEQSFARGGLSTRRVSYELNGRQCHNIEAEIRGSSSDIFVIGAHYDSVLGCPGANDNGSGIAAVLALSRRFAGISTTRTLRFVAFVNEEPPYFLSPQMGSYVYAEHCKQRGDEIRAMISLETIGYFLDAPNSQSYPAPGFGAFYPKTGNFIGFVANVASRELLQRTMSIFRGQKKLPSQGAALPGFIPGVSWSDHWSFWQHGYPAIMITDTAPFRYPHYHLSSDTPDKLDYDRFALVVSGMESVIADLAGVTR